MKRFKWSLMTIMALSLGALALPVESVAQCTDEDTTTGDCGGTGCGACEGPDCDFGGPIDGVSVSVVSGLGCTSTGDCPTDCEDPDTLTATGKVTLSGSLPSTGHYINVCETITSCTNPETLACARCTTDLGGTTTLDELACEDLPSGEYQYRIFAYISNDASCDECSESPCAAVNVADCSDCSPAVSAQAASCCLTIP